MATPLIYFELRAALVALIEQLRAEAAELG
jgi:hypothetical protein